MAHGGQRRHGRGSLVASCVLALGGWPLAALAVDFGFDTSRFDVDLAVSSDYVVHGVTRSQGEPVVQAQLGWTGESGWMVGTWLSTIDLNPGPGPDHEIDPYIARRWLVSRDWSVRTDLTRYMFRPRSRIPYDYTEIRGALSYRDVLDLAVSWSPDYSGWSLQGTAVDRTMLTYEASGHFPVTRWLGLNAGIGLRDLEEVFGTRYWYWSAGTEVTIQRFSFALTYIGSSYGAGELYTSDYAGNRFVATLAVRLR
jgi:uncharacterized protein (TIGR02001 family)